MILVSLKGVPCSVVQEGSIAEQTERIGSYITPRHIKISTQLGPSTTTRTPLLRGLYGARRGDHHALLRASRIRADSLDLLDDVHALFDLAEDDVLAVQP